MPRPLRLLGLCLGLSAGTAWGQPPPPGPPTRSSYQELNGGLDLGLLRRPPGELPARGGLMQGTGRIEDPAANGRGVPTTFGSAHVRPVGDWLNQPAAPRGLEPFPAIQSTPLTPPAGPAQPAGYTVPAAAEPVVPFDAATVEVRYQRGR